MLKAICRIVKSSFVDRQIRSNYYILTMEVLEVVEGSQSELLREPFTPLFCVCKHNVEPDVYMCTINVQVKDVTTYEYHGETVYHKVSLNRCDSVSKLSNQLKEQYK